MAFIVSVMANILCTSTLLIGVLCSLSSGESQIAARAAAASYMG